MPERIADRSERSINKKERRSVYGNRVSGIGDYLIEELVARGRHVFGVPGDYVLGFFKN